MYLIDFLCVKKGNTLKDYFILHGPAFAVNQMILILALRFSLAYYIQRAKKAPNLAEVKAKS